MRSIILILLFIIPFTVFSSRGSGTLSNPSNYILVDLEGKNYNLDSLLDEGKFIVLHTLSET